MDDDATDPPSLEAGFELLEAATDRGLRDVVELAPVAMMVLDLEGRAVLVNRAMEAFLGDDARTIRAAELGAYTHPDDRPGIDERFAELLTGRLDRFRVEQRHVRRDGEVVWGEVLVALLRDPAGAPALAVAMVEDTTERRALEEQLRTAGATYRLLVEESPAVVYLSETDLRRPWRYISPAIARLLGVEADEWLAHPELWWDLMSDLDRPAVARLVDAAVADDTGAADPHVLHYRMQHRDGRERWIRDEFRVVDDTAGDRVIRGMLIDVTREKILEADLERQALHDALTSLANRQLFSDRVGHAMARRRGEATGHDAIVFIDLDDFKVVNDSLGHAAGDELIRSVGDRLQACLRPVDTAGRLGGDEFALLLEGLGDRDEALVVADRVRSRIEEPHRVAGRWVTSSASLGVAYLEDATSADVALRNADLAMYRAKRLGKGRLASYEPSLHSSAVRRMDIRSGLDEAVVRGELAVHVQPVVDLRSGRARAVEALLRWTHPVFGEVNPDEFVPIAEETGAIVPIGAWVVEQVAAWLAGTEGGPAARLSASVNLSPTQLGRGHFVAHVARVLDRTGIAPRRLVFEVTEQALVVERAWQELEGLHALGVRIAVDDFGTGYASLAYLSRLAVDVLKIDRAFVAQLDGSARHRAVPRAIDQLAASLGLVTVAEGVETRAQRDELREVGCRLGQGFLFSPPVPLEGATEALAGRRLGPA